MLRRVDSDGPLAALGVRGRGGRHVCQHREHNAAATGPRFALARLNFQ